MMTHGCHYWVSLLLVVVVPQETRTGSDSSMMSQKVSLIANKNLSSG